MWGTIYLRRLPPGEQCSNPSRESRSEGTTNRVLNTDHVFVSSRFKNQLGIFFHIILAIWWCHLVVSPVLRQIHNFLIHFSGSSWKTSQYIGSILKLIRNQRFKTYLHGPGPVGVRNHTTGAEISGLKVLRSQRWWCSLLEWYRRLRIAEVFGW